jgi:hypothetical protein
MAENSNYNGRRRHIGRPAKGRAKVMRGHVLRTAHGDEGHAEITDATIYSL